MDRFEIPLDIPGIKIEKVEITKVGDIMIYVRSTIDGTYCHKCGRWIAKPYGYGREITLRDLQILGRRTFIVIVPPKYICEFCDDHPTTTQQAEWYDRKSHYTKRYEKYLLLSLINSTISDVSMKEGLGYESVTGIIDRYISKDTDWKNIKLIEIVGIDDISLKKGHKDYVTIITGCTYDQLTILGIVKGRKKDDVKSFLLGIPYNLRKKVDSVCTDMYEGYINAAKEVFGRKVKVIADRFHVAKLYRKSLEQLRKKEMKRLKDELSEDDYKKFKGIMWILRKNENKLTDEERKLRDDLFVMLPILGLAYVLCNELTDIFNSSINKGMAKIEIEKWKKRVRESGLSCFDTFISTLDEWMEEITNYFINKQTSGFVEGFNNKIKVIKRRCYGILNSTHLFQRIYLDVEGYALFA